MKIIRMEKTKSAEPFLYNCSVDDKVPPGARFGPVVRDVYIVECNVSGYGSAIVNGREFPVRPGDAYVLLPGDIVVHTADSEDPRRGYFCAVGGMRFGQALAEAGISSDNPYAPSSAFPEIKDIFERMLELRSDNGLGAGHRRTACVYELMGALVGDKAETGNETWLRKVLGIFETEYHNPISVSDVAAETGFERSYFSVKFKEQTGVAPHKYLTTLRVGKASKLLASTDTSVAQIAESVGLDPVNFSRLFKKEMGLSPLEYRRSRCEENVEKPRLP